MTRTEVIDLMKSSKSDKEWNANCDKVKRAFGGTYPDFWWEAVMSSGVAEDTISTWSRR